MLIALGLMAVVALIAANGWFVAGEFAYVTARRSRIEKLAERGDRRAQRALRLQERLSFVLSGAQLGITITSLLVGFIAEPTLGRAIQPLVELAGVPPQASGGIALTVGFILATAAQMVFGELAPKNLAIARPEPVALALAGTTRLYTAVAGPIIRLFDSASNRLLRAVGIEAAEELAAGVSREELELIIRRSGEEGALAPSQASLLARSLDFRRLHAGDVMVPRPRIVSISGEATCEELRQLAVASGHSRFPAIGRDVDDIRGIVHVKDILRVAPGERSRAAVGPLAHRAPAVPESAPLGSLLTAMRTARSQVALVVDEYGATAGIVTLEDLAEELVGSIQDEYDTVEPSIVSFPDGSFVVPGSWRVDETVRETGAPLPEGDYDTIGGLVMARLERVPRVGDVVAVPGAELTVEEMHELAVGRVRLMLRQLEGAESDTPAAPRDGSEPER
ncbi:MAG TPA: hemolysin family protein [Egibacteraceae bacterium]|nr:hemolysin family protein [Egibacteraceae bacterium]